MGRNSKIKEQSHDISSASDHRVQIESEYDKFPRDRMLEKEKWNLHIWAFEKCWQVFGRSGEIAKTTTEIL